MDLICDEQSHEVAKALLKAPGGERDGARQDDVGSSGAAGDSRARAPSKPCRKRKKTAAAVFLWSLQGMILRPPDYESDALTN